MMTVVLTETPTIVTIRQNRWLRSGPLLMVSLVLHGLLLLSVSLIGGNGLYGTGGSGTGAGNGDSLMVTWIPGGGGGGGGRAGRGPKFNNVVSDSADEEFIDAAPTMQHEPEPASSPLVTAVPTDPNDVFNAESSESLISETSTNVSVSNQKTVRVQLPTVTDPDEDVPISNRHVAPVSARSTGGTGRTSSDHERQGLSGGSTEGEGTGEGQGSGSGGNGAAGKAGQGVSFFGLFAKARKVVYLIDASESMRQHKAMELAKEKLLNSLHSLPLNAQFQIVFFNLNTHAMGRAGEKMKLLAATSTNLRLAEQFIAGIQPESGTDRMAALTFGLGLDPDVIYLLTDADGRKLTAKELSELRRSNKRKAIINVVEFGIGGDLSRDSFLKQLSRENSGSHFYYDLTAADR